MTTNLTSEKLRSILDASSTPYRLMEHAPEGRTDLASIIRGNPLNKAAKAMVLFAAGKKGPRQYILAVVSGHRRIDFDAVKALSGSSYVGFAPREKAEELTGCEMGSVPPFSFHPDLKLVVDPELLRNDEIVFNAARLDQSIFLSSEAYVALARPAIHPITQEAQP